MVLAAVLREEIAATRGRGPFFTIAVVMEAMCLTDNWKSWICVSHINREETGCHRGRQPSTEGSSSSISSSGSRGKTIIFGKTNDIDKKQQKRRKKDGKRTPISTHVQGESRDYSVTGHILVLSVVGGLDDFSLLIDVVSTRRLGKYYFCENE